MTIYLERGTSSPDTATHPHPRFPKHKIGSALAASINSETEGVVILDDYRHIVLVNRKVEKMFGYRAEELLDQPMELLLPAQICAEQRRRLERLSAIRMTGKRINAGLTGLHADGSTFPLRATVSRISLDKEVFLVAQLSDLGTQAGAARKSRTTWMADLRRLAASSQQASEIEKRRFSRELYDDIGQRLSVLKLDLDWLENAVPHTDKHVPVRVAQMQDMLDKVISLTKGMASTLRPPLLDDFGLAAAVEWMADQFRKKTGIHCRFENRGIRTKLNAHLESAVFRVIQEALANIERHAEASEVSIALEQFDRRLRLSIRDDGVGMPPDTQAKPGCYGLIAMQERILVLGGTISVKNAKPQGVAVCASIPIDPFPFQ